MISEVYMLSKHDDVRTFLNVLPVLLLYDASIMTIINTSYLQYRTKHVKTFKKEKLVNAQNNKNKRELSPAHQYLQHCGTELIETIYQI